MKNNPYIGPRPFERQHRDRFFGRDKEGRELQALIVAEREVLFYAQSGAGKSSLLNARVIPGLEEEGYTVFPVARVGNELPPAVDPGEVANIFVFSTLLSLAGAEAEPKALAKQTLVEWLREPCQAELPILIFDQFEELFTTHRERWQEAEGFIRQVRQALDEYPNLGVVFAMREDYLASIDNFVLFFARRLRARFRMELLGGAGALAAVKQPAVTAGCRFEVGVAEKLVDNLRQIKVQSAQAGGQETSVPGPYVEPVQLQVVCSRLWENLPEQADSTIDWADIEQYGDIDRALTAFYESAVNAALIQTKQAAPEITLNERMVRHWFGEQLITPMGTRGLVMRGPEETAGLPNAAVEALDNQHIIRADLRAGARWYELSHDRFVDPILKANQEWQLLQGPLMQAAQAWETSGRHKGKLYHGQQLEEALAGLERNGLDPLIQEFLTASEEENLAAQAETRRKAEEERAKEAEAQARQQTGAARRRIVMLGLMILMTLIVVAISFWGSSTATEKIKNVDDVRVPGSLVASRAQADLRQALAEVRGYLALGDSGYRKNYIQSAQAFETDLVELQRLSAYLGPDGKDHLDKLQTTYEKWKPIPEQLFELRDNQLDREPAYQMLATEGVQYAGSVMIDINTMISQQSNREASTENLAIMADMAKFQGSFSAMLSALRGYVTTRNRIYRDEYEVNLTDNQNTLDRLQVEKNKLTDTQQKLLDNIAKSRDAFVEVPDQIFIILESDQWRTDLYRFTNEAVPLADQMDQNLKYLVENQQTTLAAELSSGRDSLNVSNQFLIGSGIVAIILGLLMIGMEMLSATVKRLKHLGQLPRLARTTLAAGAVVLVITCLAGLFYLLPLTSETYVSPLTPTKPSSVDVKILTIWHPESPVILNPHLSSGVKDWEPSRIVYEPLASFDKDGALIPILAAEIPSLENGGLSADRRSVTWKLREGLRWSDGQDLTTEDVLFTYKFATDPAVNASSASYYTLVQTVEVIDKTTIKITFKNPTPAWATPFIGTGGVIIPKHVFEAYQGKDVRNAPPCTMPVGSGPYRVVEPGIKPQEVILLGSQVVKTNKIVFEPNPYYRFPEKIAFGQIIWLGGGTTSEAARLLYQTGTLDLAYNIDIVSPTELSKIQTDKGNLLAAFGTVIGRIVLNRTDPNKASEDGEFSSLKVPHPLFSDKRIRQAVAYAIDRDTIAKLYGVNGTPTSVNLVSPPQYKSPNIFYSYDLAKANALLDEAGYLDTDGDGFREKDGVKIKLVFQGVANANIQATQKIVQKDFKKIGIDVEIKIVNPAITFDLANPDSAYHFNADLLVLNVQSASPDPSSYMSYWKCSSIPQKSNGWTGENGGINFERWCNPDYDALLEKAKIELDPKKRQEMFIQLNDMQIEDVVMVPTVWRATALGVSQRLIGLDPTPWDSKTWNIQDWRIIQP